jgi:hypothetical protein
MVFFSKFFVIFFKWCSDIWLNSNSLTHSLTHSRGWALLEKPPIVKLLRNFPAFYAIRRFITVFTRVLHWSLSWASSIQFTPSHLTSLRSISLLSTHLLLGLPSGLLPHGFPTNNWIVSDEKVVRFWGKFKQCIFLIIYPTWRYAGFHLISHHVTSSVRNLFKKNGNSYFWIRTLGVVKTLMLEKRQHELSAA